MIEGARLAAEEMFNERLIPSEVRNQVTTIITKHFPSGDVQKLREALGELVKSVNAFMASCESRGVKVPFIPCEVLAWDLKEKVKSAEAALDAEAKADCDKWSGGMW